MSPSRSYVRFADSWHVLGTVPLDGWDTRCGRHITTGQKARMSDALPLGEKSCETCLRLVVADEAERERRQILAERDPQGVDMAGGGSDG